MLCSLVLLFREKIMYEKSLVSLLSAFWNPFSFFRYLNDSSELNFPVGKLCDTLQGLYFTENAKICQNREI